MPLTRDFLDGQLLIAMPNMTDPRFERTVVLVCAHDPAHAFGLIVNRPLSKVTLGDVLDRLEIPCSASARAETVGFGGPVEMERGAVLHTLDYNGEGTRPAAPGVALTQSRQILADIGDRDVRAPRRFLFLVGYAGWGPGQLESEIAMNAWAHCNADLDLVFSDDPSGVWEAALGRLGVTAAMLSPAWLAARPEDAPLN